MELSRYQRPEWQEPRDAERAALDEFQKAQVRITGLLANHDGSPPEDLRRVFSRLPHSPFTLWPYPLANKNRTAPTQILGMSYLRSVRKYISGFGAAISAYVATVNRGRPSMA
jgi:hypothetical protein